VSLCKECGAQVEWVKDNGKWRCLNLGSEEDHWDKCSEIRTMRQFFQGKPFADDIGEGYETANRRMYIHQVATTHRGKPVKTKLHPESVGLQILAEAKTLGEAITKLCALGSLN